MLLEFRVRNYKSFREETVLSMIATSDKALLQENTVETGMRKLRRICLQIWLHMVKY